MSEPTDTSKLKVVWHTEPTDTAKWRTKMSGGQHHIITDSGSFPSFDAIQIVNLHNASVAALKSDLEIALRSRDSWQFQCGKTCEQNEKLRAALQCFETTETYLLSLENKKLTAAFADLRQENEKLREDKKRLDWLQQDFKFIVGDRLTCSLKDKAEILGKFKTEPNLRAAIDAARQGEK